MSEAGLGTVELRDDRVLPYTRLLSLLIIPFFWRKIGGLHGFQAEVAASGHPHASEVYGLR